jgi:hypothetical protein
MTYISSFLIHSERDIVSGIFEGCNPVSVLTQDRHLQVRDFGSTGIGNFGSEVAVISFGQALESVSALESAL